MILIWRNYMQNSSLKIRYIPKRRGYRKIVTYKNGEQELRNFHRNVNMLISKRVIQSKFAKAYIKNRSIISNAKEHMYNDIFIMVDIKDFFQSINHTRMTNLLFREINKGNKKTTVTKVTCRKIVESCSISDKGLGVGLVPSPALANIYLKQFDGILYGTLKKMNLENVRYTRYADDMTISYRGISAFSTEIIDTISRLLKRYGLKLNSKKSKIIDLEKSNHVRVTGIIISKGQNNNRVLTVGRKRKNELYQNAIKLVKKEKSNRSESEINRVKGMQSFILSVEGIEYENTYSEGMQKVITDLGYRSLKEMIDSLEGKNCNKS